MLGFLLEADRSVSTIAGHFQMSRPALSQHLRVLLEQYEGFWRRYGLKKGEAHKGKSINRSERNG